MYWIGVIIAWVLLAIFFIIILIIEINSQDEAPIDIWMIMILFGFLAGFLSWVLIFGGGMALIVGIFKTRHK